MIFAYLLLAGCWIYCILAIFGTLRHRRERASNPSAVKTGISILKPLAGLDHELEANLRSYFEQASPAFEELARTKDSRPVPTSAEIPILSVAAESRPGVAFELLFAVRHAADPAARVVERLQRAYPHVASRLILTGEPPYPHDKVFKLQSLLDLARYDLVVMSDSDVRVGPDFCQALAVEFSDPALDLATCPYRAIAGASLWSQLEAIGMNTDFHAGLFTAVLMEGTKFAVGPTIVARRSVLQALGGMERFKDYLSSEDFMLGRAAADAGYGVRLSAYVVEHHIGAEGLRQNFAHRLRWARTTRRSRPWGYVGQFFTYPLSAALCIAAAQSFWLPLLLLTAILRMAAAWTTSQRTLGARVEWLLLPLHDILGFGFWLAGFFGNTIHWRGRRYILNRDGTLQPAA